MLTMPKLVDRAAQPTVGITKAVSMPFNDVVDRVVPELFAWAAKHGVPPSGPLFIRYPVVKMPELLVEFGFAVNGAVEGDDRVRPGIIPAGRYVSMTHWGDYDALYEATAMLMGWAEATGVKWDSEPNPDGEHFAARFEFYPTDPREEPDVSKWETEIAIKVREE